MLKWLEMLEDFLLDMIFLINLISIMLFKIWWEFYIAYGII